LANTLQGTLVLSRGFSFNQHRYDINEIVPAGLALDETIGGTSDVPSVTDFPVGLAFAGSCLAVVAVGQLMPLKLGKQQRILAGLGQFGEVVLDAGLNTPAAGLDVRAFLLGVGLAGFGDCYIGDQRGLAGRRELAKCS
jgi:hypothetical protein